MNLVLNEKKYIEEISNGTITDDILTTTIRCLIKNYVIEGKSKNEIVCLVEEYLSSRLKQKYKSKKWESYITKTVGSVFKQKKSYEKEEKEFQLNEIDCIKVSFSELEKIKLIENISAEKIAFVLLVCGRINQQLSKDNKIGTYCNREFFKDCGLSFSNANRNLINHLKQLGYAQPSSNNQSSFVEILIADIEYGDNEGIVVDDFRDFVLIYEKWIGEKIGKCGCGGLIKLTSGNKRMCNICWKEHRKGKNREKALRYYNKNKH
ncbi:hypothetical protein SAMN04487895_101732 [Paenibacillus sophorae]|uniref:Uncharacterized protein n=1 Tax=Paenibacillus sophorae TaxID=1333845 RepID=A0A1H8H1S9_9BACL|nr:hypothetical protein [Paenibacillus sophorae]SEN50312.1 hypothetical protein SAMN04487895_101732 [Paenibacillus sophorae]